MPAYGYELYLVFNSNIKFVSTRGHVISPIYLTLRYKPTIFSAMAGRYMYIEASSPRKPGDYARLESPPFDKTDGNGKCLVFWYHMSGRGMGRLNVYIKLGKTLGSAAWTASGNQGKRWLRGMKTVQSPYSSWKVQWMCLPW